MLSNTALKNAVKKAAPFQEIYRAMECVLIYRQG